MGSVGPRPLAVLLAVLLGAGALAFAAPRTPFPTWSDKRVHAEQAGPYARLDAYIAKLDQTSSQRYTVVVVQGTGDDTWATRNYLDALYRHWTAAHPRAPRLTHPRHVVILLALGNRQLAVRASPTLQQQYGLRGQAIDRTFVRPHFIGYAKAGRYAEGLENLIAKLEQAIQGRDRQAREQASAAGARRAAHIQRTKAVLEELRQGVEAIGVRVRREREAGQPVGTYEQKLARAEQLLQQANGEVEANPTAASQTAISVRRELSEIVDGIDQAARAAREVPRRLEAQATRIGQLEQQIEAAHAKGIRVDAVREVLDAIEAGYAEALSLREAQPVRALVRLDDMEKRLVTAFSLLTQEARRHDAWETGRAALVAEVARLRERYAQAKARGVDLASVGSGIEALASAEEATALRPDAGYVAASQRIEELGGRVASLGDELAYVESQHTFWNETLPRIALLVVGVLLALLVAIRLLVRLAKKRRVVARLARYEEAQIQADGRLHVLRERHRELLLTHPGYTVSLRGETRRVYDRIGDAFGDVRRAWRTVDGHWDDARDLIERQGLFGWKQLDEAYAHLGEHGPPRLDEEIGARVTRPLERLEQAPEAARAAHAAFEADVAAIDAAVAEVAGAGLATFAYAEPQRALARVLEGATKDLKHDPLGVAQEIEAARADARDLLQRTERVVAGLRRARELEASEQAIAEAHRARLAEGFLFAEEGSDPVPPLTRAAAERARAEGALDAGDPDAAATALDQSAAAAEVALEAIRLQVEGKRICAEEAPARRADIPRLRELLEATRPHADVLTREFAEASFEEVADAIELGEETLATCEQKLAEVERAADPAVQHYAHGARLVHETQTAQELLEAGLLRVASLRAELEAQRDACRAQLAQLEAERERVHGWLRAETADRPPANQRLAFATRRLERGRERAEEGRPDWVAIGALLAGAAEGLARAQALAEADVRLAAGARAEIREARTRIEEADTHYSYGVTADLDAARAQLARAGEALEAQDYEEAVVLANDAEQAAADAREAAEADVRAARRRRRRRRMQQSSSSTGWAILGSALDAMGSGRSSGLGSFRSSSSSGLGGSSSGTSSSSWSGGSGTSQSSW